MDASQAEASPGAVRERLRPLHGVPDRLRPEHVAAGIVHGALMVGAVWTWTVGWWPATVATWLGIAWLDHAALTRLHESAHGTLVRARWLNEALGITIGTLALTPLSVYRYVHHQHHAYLGGIRDPEFWPYNDVRCSRALRLAYAWSELTIGWILTPSLYSLRTARSWPRIAPHQRRRLAMEWCLLAAAWGGVLGVVHTQGWWAEFIVAHLAPAWIAGTLQTVRKFVEHIGMFGQGIMGVTRTVADRRRWVAAAASRSQLHVEHHGTHHRWARIPFYKLPEATEIVYEGTGTGRLFATYGAAVRDMLPHLLNPRVGPQWVDRRPSEGVGTRP